MTKSVVRTRPLAHVNNIYNPLRCSSVLVPVSSCFMLVREERVGKNADCSLGLKYIPVAILINFLSILLLSCYLSHLLSASPSLSLSPLPFAVFGTKADICAYTEVFGC